MATPMIATVINALTTLGKANLYLRDDMLHAVHVLERMKRDGIKDMDALLRIPQVCDEFLHWIGVISIDLPDEFMERYKDAIDWKQVTYLAVFKSFSPSFIEKYAEHLDWDLLSWIKLDESTMRANAHRLDWECICYWQKLSESFMRDHFDYLDWKHVSISQRFTLQLIREWEMELVMCNNLMVNIKREHAALELTNIDGITPDISSLIASYL